MSWLELKVPPPAWLLLSIGAMVAIDQGTTHWAAMAWPLRQQIGVGLAVLGLCLELPAVFSFIKARTTIWPTDPSKTQVLVTTGLYAVSRNPMYLGMVLILCGVAWWLSHPIAVAVIPAFMLILTVFQIRPEERILDEKFRETYRAYRRRVRRWI